MDTQKVDMFIMANRNNFESLQMSYIRHILINLDESKWEIICTTQFKNLTTSLIVSILVGSFGIDRFMIGDVGLGICKLLTCGGLGIWSIIDWFQIQNITRKKNMETFQQLLH